jgi:hypothetical protein
MSPANMSIVKPSISLATALAGIEPAFRTRLINSYNGLKTAFLDGDFDACGLRAGRFCEVLLRWCQHQLTAAYTPFGTPLGNFKDECDKLERVPKTAGHESVRILIPRCLSFLYTLRNKRGIGHEGGDVDANAIDAATGVRLADWCTCELVRLHYTISLEEAQLICDAIASRQLPQIWDVFGKRRVLDPSLSYSQQTLLLLYASPEAVPMEDLVSWTEHSNGAVYRRDVLSRLHSARLIEYDRGTEMVALSPSGVAKVEGELLEIAETV